MSESPEVVNLKQYQNQRNDLKELQARYSRGLETDINKICLQQGRLIETQARVLDAIVHDMSMFTRMLHELQMKGGQVAKQTFILLELFKEKGLASDEDMQAVYTRIMEQEKAQLVEGQTEKAPNEETSSNSE